MVLERAGVRRGLRRSFRLVNGSYWRVFGIWLLVQVVAFIAGGLLTVPFVVASTIMSSVTGASTFDLLPQSISGLGQIVSGAITYPIAAGATALLYVDLRMRREGLDIELARSAGEAGAGR